MKWWPMLQPEDREVFVTKPEFRGDWSVLGQRGRNGVTIAILCLFWWGSESADDLWASHVQDLRWCLDTMVSMGTTADAR